MKSMTGYGKAEYVENGTSLTVEIRTVNNRYFDFTCKCPKSFTALQDSVRNAVQKHVARGKVDVFINYQKEEDKTGLLDVDLSLASEYVNAATLIKEKFPELRDDFTVTSVMKMADVLNFNRPEIDVDEILPILTETIDKACESLNAMRSFEGEKLKADMLARISVIEETVNAIKERAPFVAKDYATRLEERVRLALSETEVDEARLLQEVAVFADRSNIDEELTRLTSHISHFRKICKEAGEVGKKLDFLVQEFNRESNTVCSKSNDIEVTDNALKLKCEIEKIREQIQNIE